MSRRWNLRSALALAFALLGATSASAQETLRVTFSTQRIDQQGHTCFYDQNLGNGLDQQNRNIAVVWLEDATTGAYVRTLHRWGQTYVYNLEHWAIASRMVVDSVTSATEKCYSGETCGTGTNQVTAAASLNTGAVDISDLPDGAYNVRIEMSSCEVADEYRTGGLSWEPPDMTFPFTKGRASQGPTSVGGATGFTNVTLAYTVQGGNSRPGVRAAADVSITPNGSQANATLSAIVDDDNGTPTVQWSLVDVVPAGGTAMIASPSSATTDVAFTTSGIYTFRVTATDSGSLTSSDTQTVYVNTRIVDAEADAEVYSGNANRQLGILVRNPPANYTAGAWVYTWGPNNGGGCTNNNNRSRGYYRFDVGSVVTGSIDHAVLRLPAASQDVRTDRWHDYYILADAMDDWVPNQADDEATITWNNQPVTGGDAASLTNQLVGSYRHRNDFNTWFEIDLDVATIDGYDSNGRWTFFQNARGSCNGMGAASRENAMNPHVLIVEHWQSAVNVGPMAVAGPDQSVVDVDGNGMEVVTLDGSTSSDDVAVTQYEWSEGGSVLAQNAARPSVSLGLGAHDIRLRVADGAGLEAFDDVTVVVDDRYAGNDASTSAATIDGTPTGKTYANLFANTAAGDWFVVDMAGGGELSVDVRAVGGNLDVTLYQPDAATVIDRSATAGAESVSASGLSAGLYYVQVVAPNGAADASVYELEVTVRGNVLTVTLDPSQGSEALGVLMDAGTVSLDAPAAVDVDVTLASNDAARLTLPVTALTISAGATTATFDVRLVQNAASDGNANVTIRATAAGYNPGSATFLVIDDDGDEPLVSWDQGTLDLPETGSPLVVLSAVLSAATGDDVTVPFTVAGTAALDGDVEDTNGLLAAGLLTIRAGQDKATLFFSIVDDALDESDETLEITLGAPTNAVAGSPATFTLTIRDDDGDVRTPVDPIDEEPPGEVVGGCGCSASIGGDEPAWTLLLLSGLVLLRRRRR